MKRHFILIIVIKFYIAYQFYEEHLSKCILFSKEGTHKRILSPQSEVHETVRLQESATYQFWVTASTAVGEGESTRVVTISPSNKGKP